ncbi:MAG: energy-converting hydrogenase B subunit G EhbG [Methanobrevibacter sp.]|jgi:energy-converting hydrogenase B subunit G|nr:energy-converting hydrogenase B subunit G EhbG [Methanobrevibacter sp.]
MSDTYSKISDSVNKFKNKLKKDQNTGDNVTSAMAAELTIISTVLISAIMLRHLNIILTVLIILGLGLYLSTNTPIIGKIRREQNDSLDRMTFYVILTLAILVTTIYWGIIN